MGIDDSAIKEEINPKLKKSKKSKLSKTGGQLAGSVRQLERVAKFKSSKKLVTKISSKPQPQPKFGLEKTELESDRFFTKKPRGGMLS